MSKFDAIDESLDINNSVEVIPESKIPVNKEEKNDTDRDYEYTRGNLYSLIEKGQEALDRIMEVAEDGQQPRAFEVVSQLIKNVADTTDKLMDLQQKKKDLTKEDKKSPTTVNNALFVGSTSDLSKLLKQGVINNNGNSDD
tara:strand:- start:244 stop:666 length:423 start_codon:yes stop_codon:yes gene_type:complete